MAPDTSGPKRAGRRSDSLSFLVLADIHYAGQAEREGRFAARRTPLGRELVRRVYEQTRHGARIDAVVVLGDLVNDGGGPGAREDLREVWNELERFGAPVVALLGNHDMDRRAATAVVGELPARHDIGGYPFLVFHDPYDASERATRPDADFVRLREAARLHPGQPVVALQHNPVHPPIESAYPYMLTNRGEVMRAYEEAGVVLSLSGHYHRGQSPTRRGTVTYATCPALCEAPFRYLRVQLEGRKVSVVEHALAGSCNGTLPRPRLADHHCHTEFAYCAEDITAEAAIARAREFGLERVFLTEHAGQLYLSREDFWSAAFLRDPAVCARERKAGRARMPGFRARRAALAAPDVGFGLEVECDGTGRLTLLDEDRDGWDVLVGAVHWVPETLSGSPDPRRTATEFMRATEHTVRGGVDILAHPFRLFRRARLPVPRELYAAVADLLAAERVAAEINYHVNRPDPEFFALCIDRGVKISLGTDAHAAWEAGALGPHLALLRQAAGGRDLDEVLFRK